MNFAATRRPIDRKKTLVVIPARLGASRLPRKPLRLLGGAPLIVRVLERVRDLGLADRVLVAADSPEVKNVIDAAGGECVLTDPSHRSGTDRVAEVARAHELRGYEVIVNVQGDEPFVEEAAIAGTAGLVASGQFPLGTAAAPASADVLSSPDVVKVVCADDGRALYFSRAPVPWLREPADAGVHASLIRQHVGIYAYTREALEQWVGLPPHPLEVVERLEQLRPLAAGVPMGVANVERLPLGGVDTEEDLARANARWANLFVGRS